MSDSRPALHRVDDLPERGLSLVVSEPLEAFIEAVAPAGIERSDENRAQPFGRSVLFHDPEGLPIQVDEYG